MLSGLGSALFFLPDFVYVPIAATVVLGVVLSWKMTCREPLDYDIYIVETQANMAHPMRRVAQVIHLGYEERSVAGNAVMDTLAGGRIFQNVEDISVVIQSPSTIVERSGGRHTPTPYMNSLRVWMMEVLGEYQSRREGGSSGLAAAIAIAVANGRNEIQTGSTRIRLVDFDMERPLREEERGRVGRRREDGERPEEEAEEEEEQEGRVPAEGGESEESRADEEHPSSLLLASRSESPPLLLTMPSTSGFAATTGRDDEATAASAVVGECIKLRLKFLDDTQTDLEVPNTITISQLKDRIVRERAIAETGIRLIYRGQLLRNELETLEGTGMENECVVHVLIGGRREEPRSDAARGVEDVRQEAVAANEGSAEERRADDLEGRLAYHMDYIREVINMSAIILMGAADVIGSSWLRVARYARNGVEERIERARREERQLGYFDQLILRLAQLVGIVEGAAAPLPGVPAVSLLFPAILGVQIAAGWCFVALLPRFFDVTSVFMLFVISSAYGFFYRQQQQQHARVAAANDA